MNAETKIFQSNRSQAVRIPKALAFPENVKEVIVRREGNRLVITPKDEYLGRFFREGSEPGFSRARAASASGS